MNPIPLTDPSGTVRAYVCGVCNNVRGSGSMLLGAAVDAAYAQEDAARSLGRATRCCACDRCGTPIPIGAPTFAGMCSPCGNAWHERARWTSFGRIWRDISEAERRGIWDADSWAARDDDEAGE